MKNLTLIFASLLFLCACQKKESASSGALEPKEFQEKIGLTLGAVVLDVRTPEEVAEGIIPGAINLDYKSADFKTSIDALDKSKTYFVYCASGGRSGKTADLMKEKNFNSVYSLAGGLKAWTESGLETVKP